MSSLRHLFQSLQRIWPGDFESRLREAPLPPISYPSLLVVKRPPRNEEIQPGSVTIVRRGRHRKWSMFLCPCGCGSVVTLSLQPDKSPHWTFRRSKGGRATLRPSVWRDVGCKSHFFLNDGRIHWCPDSGLSPEEVRGTWYRS